MTMTKAEKAEMDALRRQVRELEGHVEVLRGTVKIAAPVGHVLLSGYGDEPLPLGRYFRLAIEGGPSDGLEVCLSDGFLAVRCDEGTVMALPNVTNVMRFVRGYLVGDGVVTARKSNV